MKKILAWMLTLLVLLGSVPLTAQTAQAGNAEPVDGELTVGSMTEVIVENKEETHYLRFTPQEDGVYVFESAAGEDTYGYLYDAEWEWITDDDDGGGNGEFRIIATLAGGETYYVGAMYYAHQKTGTIPVSARKGGIRTGDAEAYPFFAMLHGRADLGGGYAGIYLYASEADAESKQVLRSASISVNAESEALFDSLQPDTTYWYQTFGYHSDRDTYGYGEVKSFTTPALTALETLAEGTTTLTLTADEGRYFALGSGVKGNYTVTFTNARCEDEPFAEYLWNGSAQNVLNGIYLDRGSDSRMNPSLLYLCPHFSGMVDVTLTVEPFAVLTPGQPASSSLGFTFTATETALYRFTAGSDFRAPVLDENGGQRAYISGKAAECVLMAGTTVTISAGTDSMLVENIASVTVLTTDREQTVQIPESAYQYFIFTPETDGEYAFYTVSDLNTNGTLWDANMKRITSSSYGGQGNNFVLHQTIMAGETDILSVGKKGSGSGTANVGVKPYIHGAVTGGVQSAYPFFATLSSSILLDSGNGYIRVYASESDAQADSWMASSQLRGFDSVRIGGLEPETTYWYRAYGAESGKNAATYTGELSSFTTPAVPEPDGTLPLGTTDIAVTAGQELCYDLGEGAKGIYTLELRSKEGDGSSLSTTVYVRSGEENTGWVYDISLTSAFSTTQENAGLLYMVPEWSGTLSVTVAWEPFKAEITAVEAFGKSARFSLESNAATCRVLLYEDAALQYPYYAGVGYFPAGGEVISGMEPETTYYAVPVACGYQSDPETGDYTEVIYYTGETVAFTTGTLAETGTLSMGTAVLELKAGTEYYYAMNGGAMKYVTVSGSTDSSGEAVLGVEGLSGDRFTVGNMLDQTISSIGADHLYLLAEEDMTLTVGMSAEDPPALKSDTSADAEQYTDSWYRFTPSESGYYEFRMNSDGMIWLYDGDGNVQYGYGYEGETALTAELEAETYLVSFYSYADGAQCSVRKYELSITVEAAAFGDWGHLDVSCPSLSDTYWNIDFYIDEAMTLQCYYPYSIWSDRDGYQYEVTRLPENSRIWYRGTLTRYADGAVLAEDVGFFDTGAAMKTIPVTQPQQTVTLQSGKPVKLALSLGSGIYEIQLSSDVPGFCAEGMTMDVYSGRIDREFRGRQLADNSASAVLYAGSADLYILPDGDGEVTVSVSVSPFDDFKMNETNENDIGEFRFTVPGSGVYVFTAAFSDWAFATLHDSEGELVGVMSGSGSRVSIALAAGEVLYVSGNGTSAERKAPQELTPGQQVEGAGSCAYTLTLDREVPVDFLLELDAWQRLIVCGADGAMILNCCNGDLGTYSLHPRAVLEAGTYFVLVRHELPYVEEQAFTLLVQLEEQADFPDTGISLAGSRILLPDGSLWDWQWDSERQQLGEGTAFASLLPGASGAVDVSGGAWTPDGQPCGELDALQVLSAVFLPNGTVAVTRDGALLYLSEDGSKTLGSGYAEAAACGDTSLCARKTDGTVYLIETAGGDPVLTRLSGSYRSVIFGGYGVLAEQNMLTTLRTPVQIEGSGDVTRGAMAKYLCDLVGIDGRSPVEFDFTDIADSPYRDAINDVWYLGLMDGFEDGSFRPEETVSRAQFATIIVRCLEKQGYPLDMTPVSIPDVDAGYVYSAAYFALVNAGVLTAEAAYPDETATVDFVNGLTGLLTALCGMIETNVHQAWAENSLVYAVLNNGVLEYISSTSKTTLVTDAALTGGGDFYVSLDGKVKALPGCSPSNLGYHGEEALTIYDPDIGKWAEPRYPEAASMNVRTDCTKTLEDASDVYYTQHVTWTWDEVPGASAYMQNSQMLDGCSNTLDIFGSAEIVLYALDADGYAIAEQDVSVNSILNIGNAYVTLSDGGSGAVGWWKEEIFRLLPQVGGTYVMAAQAGTLMRFALFDADGVLLASEDFAAECRYTMEAGETYYLAANNYYADTDVIFNWLPPVEIEQGGTAEMTSEETLTLMFTVNGEIGIQIAAAAYDAEGRLLDMELAVLTSASENVEMELNTYGEDGVTWKLMATNSDFEPLMQAITSFR